MAVMNRRSEPQGRDPVDLVEGPRIVEDQQLRQVAQEGHRAAGRHLGGVAAGHPLEEPDLGLPRVGVGIAAQPRDPGPALEAVEAVTVEGDEEVEAGHARRLFHRSGPVKPSLPGFSFDRSAPAGPAGPELL